MNDDIVTTLRGNQFYHPTSRINSFGMPQMGFELTSFNLIAADEIERLRQLLGNSEQLQAENATLRRLLDQFVGEFKDEVQREAL